MAEMSKETEKQIMEFQQGSAQMQMLANQRYQVQAQLNEVTHALEELEKSSGRVFKTTGSVIIESDKQTMVNELTEKKESLGVRLSALSKQEETTKKKLEDLRKQISASPPQQASG